ncbi:TetR/AcrR family transcriptional regulator [Companilactobacillus jidongensis]|uniref:TetR/AcrR family transcriptional regulator n=1 Tax=Companilactobacillus jidongensis TaxID=2486006 RepID=UPI000F7AA67F|nr:TetR/AcrR family transcriptional regulator [Companilactobacillus jidongensis]
MVSNTFKNLDNEKQTRILDTLLNEFSNHTLADAQVSRIVNESGIARGAFYKYFDDLRDAYEYLYHHALKEIHQNISTDTSKKLTPTDYVEQTKEFVKRSTDSRYYTLVKMHMLYNESFFISTFNNQLINGDEYFWATQIMIHDAIKQTMIDPQSQKMILKKLSNVLHALAKEDD